MPTGQRARGDHACGISLSLKFPRTFAREGSAFLGGEFNSGSSGMQACIMRFFFFAFELLLRGFCATFKLLINTLLTISPSLKIKRLLPFAHKYKSTIS